MNATPATAGTRRRALLANTAVLLALAACALVLSFLHDGPWWPATPRPRQWWIAAACLLAWAGLCAWSLRRSRDGETLPPAATAGGDAILVAYASQTGFGHGIARRTFELLRDAGAPCTLRALGAIDAQTLRDHGRVLLVASTTGEGDPPDQALPFVAREMSREPDLSGVRYAVLALGDRGYARFCAFGHRLEQWLQHCGARPLFDLTEVDNGDPAALRHWQHEVALLAGATDAPDWAMPEYEAWTLAARRLLNPGSAGGEAWHIELRPPAGTTPAWQAGDALEIGPCNAPDAVGAMLAALGLDGDAAVEWQGRRVTLREALSRSRLPGVDAVRGLPPQALAGMLEPLPHREYTIASLPHEGAAWLLVRCMRRPDGTPGLGSGWLCHYAAEGTAIAARLRANPGFHPPDPGRPLVLVGNGTGIAGLRALLAARAAAGARRNWLVYGERNADRDDFYRDDIARWRREGLLEQLDRVFSRDGGPHRYVQDALRARAGLLRGWVRDGAAVYVCGSLRGMAPAVDEVLRDALGDDEVEAMLADGRYRRDVY